MDLALTAGMCAGGGAGLLAWWGRCSLVQRRRRLASAFVGELVAILRIVEDHQLEDKLSGVADGSADGFDLAGFALPPLTIYQADAGHLDRFPAPMPRQIALFYTRLGALQADLQDLATKPSAARAETVLAELREILAEADEALRALRRFVSRRRPNSITRA
jgi:hypothetical protein